MPKHKREERDKRSQDRQNEQLSHNPSRNSHKALGPESAIHTCGCLCIARTQERPSQMAMKVKLELAVLALIKEFNARGLSALSA